MPKKAYRSDPPPPFWMGSSKRDLIGFPTEIRRAIGSAIWEAQEGGKADYAKPLKGFGGANVLEIVADGDGTTFRGVYTVRFDPFVYVLHCFQKKSKSGIATPKADMDLIADRLKRAKEHYEEWQKSKKSK